MPISKEQIAKTSAFQRNCLLNCLSHVLLNNIDQIPKQSLEALRKAFNAYYETNLDFKAFKQAIQIENPIHREVILGPVLRTMLGDKRVVGKEVAEKNCREGINQPGNDLEDSDIIPLANFFGIYVESYSSLRAQALTMLARNATETEISAKVKTLHEENPDIEQDNRFAAHPETHLSVAGQLGAIEEARGGVGLEDNPVLKLWNKTAGHFEYEETDVEAAEGHNDVYEGDRFSYGSTVTGEPSPEGEPDATLIRRKIRQKSESYQAECEAAGVGGVEPELDLSAVLKEHEAAENSCRTTEIDENPFSFGFDASEIFGGFSSIGQKIVKAFAAPFVNDSGSFDSDFQPTSGGWMGIIEGVAHFAMKLVQVFTGLVDIAPELGKAFNPGAEEVSPDLSSRFSKASTAFEIGATGSSADAGRHLGVGSGVHFLPPRRPRTPAVVEVVSDDDEDERSSISVPVSGRRRSSVSSVE